MRGLEWEARVVLIELIGVSVDRGEEKKKLEVEKWTEESDQWEEWLNMESKVWCESADAKKSLEYERGALHERAVTVRKYEVLCGLADAMKSLEYERGALHERAVAIIDSEGPSEPADAMKFLRYERGALHDRAVANFEYKALCGPADAMKSLEFEHGALHERVVTEKQDNVMNTQYAGGGLNDGCDHRALHGRAGGIVCVQEEVGSYGAGVMCSMSPVSNMSFEVRQLKSAPSISEDRQSCNLGVLFGTDSVKRKIKLFDNMGSPKLKQPRIYVRESERPANKVITDTAGETG
jgi:hypothetical protein